VLEEMAEILKTGARAKKPDVMSEIMYSVACKAACKAGQKNSERELSEIARRVLCDDDIRYCPHGRPVMLEYTKGEVRHYHKNGLHKPGGGTERESYDVIWKYERKMAKETQHEIRHFADCIFNDKVPNTNARQSLQSLRVIWALYKAEENNTVADLRGLGFENA
jgi:hypothetical protein